MSDTADNPLATAQPMPPVLIPQNMGAPVHLSQFHIDGVAADAARAGETIKVWTRLALTSDDPYFHRIAQNLSNAIRSRDITGRSVDLERTKVMLVVIKPDHSAELWADNAAMTVNILSRRTMQAGSVVMEDDIADVAGLGFPAVNIGKEDKVICLFRQDYRFALFFDFNPAKNFDLEGFQRTLGTLYRNLKYRHVYDAIANPAIFDKLVLAGWFPFSEVMHKGFSELVQHVEAGFDLQEVEGRILASFTPDRVERMLTRWLAKPHLKSREAVLRSAVRSFLANDPVATIKTVLTEIEGALNAAYRATHGDGAKINKLLTFAIESAEKKAGSPHTLLLPQEFAAYLKLNTYAHYDPVAGTGKANSRHAVGHGEAPESSYTQVAALQALLTLDQFALFT